MREIYIIFGLHSGWPMAMVPEQFYEISFVGTLDLNNRRCIHAVSWHSCWQY